MRSMTGHEPILTIEDAEPIGPKSLFDILLIAPCTGTTLAKLACGITDTPVLMAAKSHLRGGKPLLISISTNDALGSNLQNLAVMMNKKHVYFVPFGQDASAVKPNSMAAHPELIIPALELALEERQLQPVLSSPF